MRKKARVSAIAGVVIVIVAIFLFITKDMITQTFPVLAVLFPSDLSTQMQEISLSAQQQKTLSDAESAIAAAEKALASVQEDVPEELLDESTPWQLSTGDKTPQPSIPLNEKVKVYGVVKLNPHPEHMPKEGDQVVMPLLNGQSVKVNVESNKTAENGDYIWNGHLVGNSDNYPIIMTYGANLTFATITTPEGSYSMESRDGVGWLYKNPSVAELSKPGGTDYVELDPHAQ